MSWSCIPYTYLQEREEESWQIYSSVTLQSRRVKSKSIPEKFCYKGSLTEYYQSFRFGTILQRSEAITQNAQKRSQHGRRCQMNSSCAAGSRNVHVKTSALPERGQALTESDQECGNTWHGSFAKYNRDSCSWKTHQRSLLGDWEPFLGTWPRWGTMRNGVCLEQTTLELRTEGNESGFWPTPNSRDWKDSGPTQGNRKSPNLGTVVGGKLNPAWVEWLMGWPAGWTDLNALEMDRFQQWQRQHLKFCMNDYQEEYNELPVD